MNKFKVIIQLFIILLPLMVYPFLPPNLLWGLIAFLGDREISELKSSVGKVISSSGLISLLLCLIISIIILFIFRFINKEKTFNTGSGYFDYPIICYSIAGRILGYGRITLIRVPVYLQFKLLFKDMFPNIDSDSHPEKYDDPKINTYNMDEKSNEVNLILSDTHQIETNDLPDEKRSLPTIFIERTIGFTGNRTYNPKFTFAIRKETNTYRLKYKRVNVFATTNTEHTKEIVSQSFNNGGRTGFKEVYVYEQGQADNDYAFVKAHRIL